MTANPNEAIVTPEGYPMAYEVLPGNTADKRDELILKVGQAKEKAGRAFSLVENL